MAEKNKRLAQVSNIDQTQILSLEKDLQELTTENYKLAAELKENFKTVSMLKHSNVSLKQKNKDLEKQKDGFHTEMKKIVTQNSDYLRQITDLKEEIDNTNIELSIAKKAQASSVPQEQVRILKQRNKDLISSNSYQIGQIFAKAISEPGINTVMMPFRLLRFVASLLFKRD